MTSISYHADSKHIRLKAYRYLRHLEEALQFIENKKELQLQISVLGKVIHYNADKANIPTNKNIDIDAYWKSLLGNTADFGDFYNPELGTVFIAGHLTSTFLHEIDNKVLAKFSAGPYSIFRGMGLTEIQATTYLKMLNSGNFLLVFRGYTHELHELETMLNEPI